MLIIQAIIVSIIGGIIFSIIGIIPGTDETATMAPITLILVLMGFEPVVIFAWFIAILVAMQITHTIPTAMAALPGSTMAVPMVENSNIGKKLGIPHISMRKMSAGSMIGSLIGLPIAILFAQILAPLSDIITQYSGLIFTIAACVIAFMSQAKIGAVVALIPFAFLNSGITENFHRSSRQDIIYIYFHGNYHWSDDRRNFQYNDSCKTCGEPQGKTDRNLACAGLQRENAVFPEPV